MNFTPLWLSLLIPFSQPPGYLVSDLRGPARVDYLVVAADDFAGDCDSLLAHRAARGHTVGLVRFGDACRAFSDGPPGPEALVAFLKHAHDNWQTRYVLLVGDARGLPGRVIPMRIESASYFSDTFLSSRDLATDHYYATLGGNDVKLHVGRFPVDGREELAAMIAKTIAYETASSPGPWQRKVSFVAGAFGSGTAIDQILEAQFARIVTEGIPPTYDVEVAYAQPTSVYCPHPPNFHDNAVRLLNEGGLFYVYVGHGTRTGCDEIKWRGRSHTILDARNLGEINIANGLPVMVVIACWTSFIDAPEGDSVGEELMKLPHGPVAFLGASRICQPYGNALLGRELVSAVFDPGIETLGQAISAAKSRTLAPDDSEFRKQLDAIAGFVQGPDSLARMRRDVVRHYNLLGDPALVLQRPASDLKVEARLSQGETLTVSGQAPFAEGKALISLEVERDRFTRQLAPLPPEGAEDFATKMAQRYRDANDKALAQVEAAVEGGVFETELNLPDALAPGAYYVKVFAWNDTCAAAGALQLRIED